MSHAFALLLLASVLPPAGGVYDPQNHGLVSMCVEGEYYSPWNGLCHQRCRAAYPTAIWDRCYAGCGDGWRDGGLICSNKSDTHKVHRKDSYHRGFGRPPSLCKLGESFGPGALQDTDTRSVTAVILSDLQLPWCSKGTLMTGSYDDIPCAVHENHMLVEGINRLSSLRWEIGSDDVVEKPVGAFINGDLTAFGHEWQWDLYRRIWETMPGEDEKINMKLPIWPGLGNHDYANNVQDAWFESREATWTGYGNNGNAQRSLAYIRAAVGKCGGKGSLPNFGGLVDHYDKPSAAYTVKFGHIRMVMLHNYPTYKSCDGCPQDALTGYEPSLSFLRKEIARANVTLDYLVLYWHDFGDHLAWYKSAPHSDEFAAIADVIRGSRVIAVFCGHWHYAGGRMYGDLSWRPSRGSLATDEAILNKWGQNIPLMRSWSAEAKRFLVVQWNVYNCTWRFGTVNAPSSSGSDPTWFSQSDQRTEWILPECKVLPKEVSAGIVAV